ERRLEVLRDGRWVELQRFDLEEFNVRMLGITPDDRALLLLSSRGRDRLSLVRVDIATRAESSVYEDPELDRDQAIVSERAQEPLAAITYPRRPVIRVFYRPLDATRG